MRRKTESIPPDLPPEKAYSALTSQLGSLEKLKGRNYQEATQDEDEWGNLAEKLIIRAFGSESANARNFYYAQSAGEHQIVPYGAGIPHGQNQRNFEARIQAHEANLRSSLAELKLDLPEEEIKGVYEPGQEYEFYRDVKEILQLATKDAFIIDPYANVEIFDVYADGISRRAQFRMLTAAVPNDLLQIARKYAGGGILPFALATRSTTVSYSSMSGFFSQANH